MSTMTEKKKNNWRKYFKIPYWWAWMWGVYGQEVAHGPVVWETYWSNNLVFIHSLISLSFFLPEIKMLDSGFVYPKTDWHNGALFQPTHTQCIERWKQLTGICHLPLQSCSLSPRSALLSTNHCTLNFPHFISCRQSQITELLCVCS